jgi:hypothetical protein
VILFSNGFVNQIILKLVKQINAKRKRKMKIITKSNILFVDFESELVFMSIVLIISRTKCNAWSLQSMSVLDVSRRTIRKILDKNWNYKSFLLFYEMSSNSNEKMSQRIYSDFSYQIVFQDEWEVYIRR